MNAPLDQEDIHQAATEAVNVAIIQEESKPLKTSSEGETLIQALIARIQSNTLSQIERQSKDRLSQILSDLINLAAVAIRSIAIVRREISNRRTKNF